MIVEPPNPKTEKINGTLYHKLITEELDAVYVIADVFDDIDDLPPGREYLFGGTILDHF